MMTDNRYLVKKFLTEKLVKCIKNIPSKLILDVGCGEKPYRKYFSNATCYIGIDIGDTPADVKGTGEYLPFRKTFDTVICTQVLEHVEDPKKVLGEISRVLIDDGVLLLSTHGFWIEGHGGTDYWRWTIQGLNKILEQAGFKIIESYSMRPIPSFFQFINLFIPKNLIGRLFHVFINLSGLLLNKLGNRGPKLHAVHVIKATKFLDEGREEHIYWDHKLARIKNYHRTIFKIEFNKIVSDAHKMKIFSCLYQNVQQINALV